MKKNEKKNNRNFRMGWEKFRQNHFEQSVYGRKGSKIRTVFTWRTRDVFGEVKSGPGHILNHILRDGDQVHPFGRIALAELDGEAHALLDLRLEGSAETLLNHILQTELFRLHTTDQTLNFRTLVRLEDDVEHDAVKYRKKTRQVAFAPLKKAFAFFLNKMKLFFP